MLRRTFLTLLLSLGIALGLGAPASHAAEAKTIVLDVPGMTCRFCPITIRRALQKVPGVIEAKADYESKTATVTYDPDKTTVEALTAATANAGYESRPRTP